MGINIWKFSKLFKYDIDIISSIAKLLYNFKYLSVHVLGKTWLSRFLLKKFLNLLVKYPPLTYLFHSFDNFWINFLDPIDDSKIIFLNYFVYQLFWDKIFFFLQLYSSFSYYLLCWIDLIDIPHVKWEIALSINRYLR